MKNESNQQNYQMCFKDIYSVMKLLWLTEISLLFNVYAISSLNELGGVVRLGRSIKDWLFIGDIEEIRAS